MASDKRLIINADEIINNVKIDSVNISINQSNTIIQPSIYLDKSQTNIYLDDVEQYEYNNRNRVIKKSLIIAFFNYVKFNEFNATEFTEFINHVRGNAKNGSTFISSLYLSYLRDKYMVTKRESGKYAIYKFQEVPYTNPLHNQPLFVPAIEQRARRKYGKKKIIHPSEYIPYTRGNFSRIYPDYLKSIFNCVRYNEFTSSPVVNFFEAIVRYAPRSAEEAARHHLQYLEDIGMLERLGLYGNGTYYKFKMNPNTFPFVGVLRK